MMSEKRFTIKSTATELKLYDNGVKIGEFPHYEWVARPVDYVVKTLNEQQATIEELRLQEKGKGVPVFVVRDGKNPVALFFNEQRAMYYCQENMAHLTYQQEKWCRVE